MFMTDCLITIERQNASESKKRMANEYLTKKSTVSESESKFKLYSADALMEFPDAEWLIDEMIEVGALAVLYGPSKSAKSFTALDLALSIASGRPWQGFEVKPGNVVYVVGEGTRGIKRRVLAWKQVNGVEKVGGAFFVMQAPKVLDPKDLGDLTTKIKAESAAVTLVVIDTLATSFVGGDENTSKDMGDFIDACRRFQNDLSATLLLIHHTGKGKNTQDVERGSSVLRGAADVMILQRMSKERIVSIRNVKQKDDEEFPDLKLKLVTVPLKTAAITAGKKTPTSCVLSVVESGDTPTPAAAPAISLISASERLALEVLIGYGASLPSGEWRDAVFAEKGDPVPLKTFHNWRMALVAKGYVEPDPEKAHHYRPTAAGNAIGIGTHSKAA